MPRRASLSDALGGDEPEPQPPFSPELDRPHPSEPDQAPPEPETYKMTVVLTEAEHEALERLTELVVATVAPRRVGKGWRTKAVRMLLEMAGDEPALRQRVADRIRYREHDIPRDSPERRRRR